MTWLFTRQAKHCAVMAAWVLTAPLGFGAGMETFSPANEGFPRLEEIRSAAAQGDPDAQFKMGDYLYTRADLTNAVQWYYLAAEQGHRGAQISLAACYLQGRGVTKNVQEAAKWSARARGEVAHVNSTPPPPLIPTLEEQFAPDPVQPDEPKPAFVAGSVRRAVRDLERVEPELEPVKLHMQSYVDPPAELRLKP